MFIRAGCPRTPAPDVASALGDTFTTNHACCLLVADRGALGVLVGLQLNSQQLPLL